MNPLLLNALVLHRRPYRETSFIVDFITREQGRISAVCRGVRGGKSNNKSDKKSLLQPFQALTISLSGRQELKNLVQVDGLQRRFEFSGTVMFSALYLNELLNRLLPPEVSYPEIYDLYLASLMRLSQGEPLEPVLRECERNLLAYLGLGFDWTTDWVSGEPIQPDVHYEFVHEQGFRPLYLASQTQNCFSGKLLLQIDQNQWDTRTLHAAKTIFRMAFRPILGDKPLKSRELFKSMEQTK